MGRTSEFSGKGAPIAAALAVVIRDGEVLLVRRSNPPDAGRWGFPGGKIEFGERLEAAAVRELHEETGVRARALGVLTAVEAFDGDPGPSLRQHFVMVAVACQWLEGEPAAGDDAADARWFSLAALDAAELVLSFDVDRIARMASEASASI